MSTKNIHHRKYRQLSLLAQLIFVFCLGIFLPFNIAQGALLNNYSKGLVSTLQATEWNQLVQDFVKKNDGGDTLYGNYQLIGTQAAGTYALNITGELIVDPKISSDYLAGSLSAANVSSGIFGSLVGYGNFSFPANLGIGIGTSTPASVLSIANNAWISALNSSGNAFVNLFKLNANNQIEMGAPLNVSNFQFAPDSGFNTFVDMPVTNASPLDSIQGYVMKIDGDNILSVFSQADGLGGIKNRRVGINTSTPLFDLDVNGTINASDFYQNGLPLSGSKWLSEGDDIYYNAGAVGIGTNSLIGSKFKIMLNNGSISDDYHDQTKIASLVDASISGGQLQIDELFVCGASITGSDGLTYGTVLANDSNCWLDRNLGATRVATAANDSQSYGDYFQWGRAADGHQLANSGTTNTLSPTDKVSSPNTDKFIKTSSNPYDWRVPQNNNLWQGVNGINNPCPTGFRPPTNAEWQTLVSAENITNSATAYASSLKLPSAGYRSYSSASITNQGSNGFYWSSSPIGINAYRLYFNSTNVYPTLSNYRATGFSLRCFKD